MNSQPLSENLHAAITWLRGLAVGGRMTSDSRQIGCGDIFIAYPGTRFDGRNFIAAAIAQGAAAVLYDPVNNHAPATATARQIPHFPVTDLKQQCGALAALWLGSPAADMLCVGITGTSGKTSCALWVAQALSAHGQRCAVAGTIGIGFAEISNGAVNTAALTDTGLTTPDPVALQHALADLHALGARALAIEASSIGLVEGRLGGLHFDIALFTNLTRDHLDFHGSMQAYETAKAQLFAWPGLRAAVINLDDAAGIRMGTVALEHGAALLYYSAAGNQNADLYADAISYDADGMRFNIHGRYGNAQVATNLIGTYNVANLLGVVGVLLQAGLSLAAAVALLHGLAPAPGRLQRVPAPEQACEPALPMVLVDYAHKPDALEQVLLACRPLAAARGGKLSVVFGCGGDRDPGKRPLMGALSVRLADAVTITSDNPRTEDPVAIINAISTGAQEAWQYQLASAPEGQSTTGEIGGAASKLNSGMPIAAIPDRGLAIRHAIFAARPADVIILAGKGHEEYQIVGHAKLPFSDLTQAAAVLSERATAGQEKTSPEPPC